MAHNHDRIMLLLVKLKCVVPENIYTHPMNGHWEFEGYWGSQKPTHVFKESMKLKRNLRMCVLGGGGGGGSNQKTHIQIIS